MIIRPQGYIIRTTMSSEILSPKRTIVKITEQPDFPQEDLHYDNAVMLAFMLSYSAGLDAYAQHIGPRQRYIYTIANRALVQMGADTQATPAGLSSFSHGFATLETITDIVRGARDTSAISSGTSYNTEVSVQRVLQYLVNPQSDTTRRPISPQDAWDTAIESELLGYDESPEVIDDRRDYIESSYAIPLTQGMLDAYEGRPAALLRGAHDRPSPEKIFTERSMVIRQLPNVFEVLYTTGQVRRETLPQQNARLAGAGLALALLTTD